MKNLFIQLFCLLTCLFFLGCGGTKVALKDPTPSTVVWKGSWQSSKYKSVFGGIAVRFPKSIPSELEFKVPVTIGFSLENSYKPGKTYSAYYKGKLQKNVATGVGDASQPINPNDAKLLGLTSYPTSFSLIEEFTLTFNKDMNRGIGSWKSSDGDYGVFSLTKNE